MESIGRDEALELLNPSPTASNAQWRLKLFRNACTPAMVAVPPDTVMAVVSAGFFDSEYVMSAQ